jgi:hypothetical protein
MLLCSVIEKDLIRIEVGVPIIHHELQHGGAHSVYATILLLQIPLRTDRVRSFRWDGVLLVGRIEDNVVGRHIADYVGTNLRNVHL